MVTEHPGNGTESGDLTFDMLRLLSDTGWMNACDGVLGLLSLL